MNSRDEGDIFHCIRCGAEVYHTAIACSKCGLELYPGDVDEGALPALETLKPRPRPSWLRRFFLSLSHRRRDRRDTLPRWDDDDR